MNSRRNFLKGIAATAAVTQFSPSVFGSSSALAMRGAYSSRNPLLLNQNENALGMSPAAKKAATEALKIGNRYPGKHVVALASQVANREGLSGKNAILGNGSTDILKASVRAMKAVNGVIIAPTLTFGSVASKAKILGVPYHTVPMKSDFGMNLPAMEKASLSIDGSVMVYLVTPNNPTGLVVPSADLFAWIKRAPKNVFFLVDEAYHDYVTAPEYSSAIPLIKEGWSNLIVARTFSKVYGMAGMRIGYGLGSEGVINNIGKYHEGWNVNIAGVKAASISFDDLTWVKHSIKQNESARKILTNGLDALKLNYIPSQTNFMIHQIKGDLITYQKRMRDNHIVVGRDMGLGDGWNRLSFGTPEEMGYFVNTLGDFRKKRWV